MYLYFGKDGKLKTKINHDAPPRQGGDLNVTVCLDMDFWDNKEKWGVDGDKYWVKTASIISASGVLGYPQIATEGQIEVFSKLYNSEIVYDLVPGASYLMYKFRFSAEEVTKIPGQISFDLSMQNISFSDNKYVRIGTRSEFIKMVENPGNGENCISRELNDLTGKISSVVYKKGNGTQAFSDLSPVSENKYQVGTYQIRIEKSLTNNDEGFVFVQQDKNPDEYTYGEVSIWMWAKATGADTTLGWIQLPQYSTTDTIPTGGTFAFGVTDITIERTVGYARALIDKEIGIKYQDIMDEFKRVYSKIAIAGTKPDWNVGENTSPAYIYNKPNIKTVIVGDIDAIRETGIYIVKNSTIAPSPISGDYVLFHYSDSQDHHIQLVFENQNITWFRSLPSGGIGFGDWIKREIREVLKFTGAPDSSTPGIVGQFYFDSSSKYLYYCVSAINNVYTWERLVNLTYFDSEKKSIIEQINALKNKDEAINGQIANLETSINNLSSDITTITSGLNEKFDKTGGTIYGDVTVTGIVLSNEGISTKSNVSADGSIEGKDLTVHNNAVIEGNATIVGSLTVQGAVTSVETQNVSIKDQLFEIAKGDKGDIGLNSPAGFYVSNYDGNGNNLAIVFDKTGTAYVGDVSIGENGLISDTSHLQPFATRQTTEIQDKSILQWDQQSNSLKDSGKTIDDFIEKQENNTGYNCLYGQDVNNNVELVRMSQNKDQNTVPLRTERGTLKGVNAEENDEFVTLQQLNDSERGLFEQVDFLEDKINETIAVNPGKTYILIIGDSVTFTVRNDGVYSVDMGDGTIYSNISNVTKTHNYTRKGSAHIITVSGVGTNGDFGFSLGEDQNLAFRSIHFGEGIKKITNFLVSTPVDVCILPKTITDVLSDNFTDGNATLKYAKSVYCLSETPFTISKNVFANSLRIFVKRDSLDQYKQAWYQHLPASIIVSEVDSSDLVNEIVQTTGQSTTDVMSQKATTDEIATLKSDLVDLDESLFSKEVIESKNYFDLSKITIGKYVNDMGKLQPNSAYNSSGYMSVKAGETYTFQYGGLTAAGRGTYVINQIAGYDKNKQFVAGSYKTYHNSYTVPDGVAYVRASLDAGNMTIEKNLAFVKGTTVIDYAEYSEYVTVKHFNQSLIKRDIKNGIIYDFSINNNDFESDIEFQHMCANSISFRADITTFNEIRIGKGYQSYLGATLGIDNTNIYVYEGANTNPYITEPHGLTFKDYISLVISCDYGNVASVTIYTNGGKFTRQYFAWDARKGKFFVKSIGTNVLTNCSLGYYCYALEKPTWMYGDSYLTNAQGVTDRWTSYLIGGKHTNYLLNGYSGRGSIIALESLKNDLRLGTPKRIIWCLGMNNHDSDTDINTDWKTCVEELIEICKKKNIELILATIPNVPTINNSFKNEYVRNSGYRYIDFATSVGASNDTTWYDDMLSSDGVHPSIQGAIALYGQAVADVPELLS